MLASLPLPVVIISAESGGERTCSTGTVTYVSFDPPVIATPLGGRTGRFARASGEFSVSVLSDAQAELAVRAARTSEGDKFADQQIPIVEPPAGFAAPGVAGSVAVYWCRVDQAGERLLVGRVEQSSSSDAEPLLRFRRRYRGLGAELTVAEEAAYPL
jgi:flavin reductase (DIM6/NTAB) family NADH-FMN oxidoreductase RutF